MTVIHLETKVTTDQLLRVVEQLSSRDLERLQRRVALVRANRRATALPKREARLLSQINRPFAAQARYDELISKRRAESLSTEEYAELLALTQQNEAFIAARKHWPRSPGCAALPSTI